MSRSVRPSIIAQRTVSLLTGAPRAHVQRYSAVEPSAVRRPVSIGAVHVHAAAVALSQSRVVTTADAIGWTQSIRKGEF